MNNPAPIQDHATEFFSDAEARVVDDTLWWMVGRRYLLRALLAKAQRQLPIHTILEIGCGSGGDLKVLSEFGEVSGNERSSILAARARARNVAKTIYEEDFFDLKVGADFDLYCLFDVLEHIEDDDAFVSRVCAHARSDHRLLLTVPACQFLFSQHDVLLHHYRRYSRGGLRRLLEKHGYEITTSSYFVFFLFPVVLAVRMWSRLKGALGFKESKIKLGRAPRVVNAILTLMLRLEAAIVQVIPFPVGVWVVVLARKRGAAANSQDNAA